MRLRLICTCSLLCEKESLIVMTMTSCFRKRHNEELSVEVETLKDTNGRMLQENEKLKQNEIAQNNLRRQEV